MSETKFKYNWPDVYPPINNQPDLYFEKMLSLRKVLNPQLKLVWA